MWEAAFRGALSASSLLIRAVTAPRWQVAPKVVGPVMGFGAGALISAVSFDLVEETIVISEGSGATAFGLTAGALTFLIGDWAVDRREGDRRKDISGAGASGNASAITLGTILDGIPKSIAGGGSIVAGGGVSAAMVATAFISNLPGSLGASVGRTKGGMSPSRPIAPRRVASS